MSETDEDKTMKEIAKRGRRGEKINGGFTDPLDKFKWIKNLLLFIFGSAFGFLLASVLSETLNLVDVWETAFEILLAFISGASFSHFFTKSK